MFRVPLIGRIRYFCKQSRAQRNSRVVAREFHFGRSDEYRLAMTSIEFPPVVFGYSGNRSGVGIAILGIWVWGQTVAAPRFMLLSHPCGRVLL